ncbi:hypothetical protein V1527DRAFT_115590 [Lipomyces starkeyi]
MTLMMPLIVSDLSHMKKGKEKGTKKLTANSPNSMSTTVVGLTTVKTQQHNHSSVATRVGGLRKRTSLNFIQSSTVSAISLSASGALASASRLRLLLRTTSSSGAHHYGSQLRESSELGVDMEWMMGFSCCLPSFSPKVYALQYILSKVLFNSIQSSTEFRRKSASSCATPLPSTPTNGVRGRLRLGHCLRWFLPVLRYTMTSNRWWMTVKRKDRQSGPRWIKVVCAEGQEFQTVPTAEGIDIRLKCMRRHVGYTTNACAQ